MQVKVSKFRWQEDNDGVWLCLNAGAYARSVCDKIKAGKVYDVTIKEHREKRSLNANAYAWVLLDKLALKLSLPRVPLTAEDLYREYCKDVSDNYDIIPVKEERIEIWNKIFCGDHIGRSTVDLGECRTKKGYHNIKCYYGSSDYDTKQMSRFIDLIVQDCKENGIETLTPDELERIKEEWR